VWLCVRKRFVSDSSCRRVHEQMVAEVVLAFTSSKGCLAIAISFLRFIEPRASTIPIFMGLDGLRQVSFNPIGLAGLCFSIADLTGGFAFLFYSIERGSRRHTCRLHGLKEFSERLSSFKISLHVYLSKPIHPN
jgi:hypothetical protein